MMDLFCTLQLPGTTTTCCSCALHVSAVHVSVVTRGVRSCHVFEDCACSDVIVHTVLASGLGTGHESSRTRDV